MKTLAPELKALIIILRSTGPVISTLRSCRSAGVLVTFQLPERMFSVSGRKRNSCPPSSSFCRCSRRFKSSSRLELNWRCRLPTKSRASLERIFSNPSDIFPEIFTDALIKPPSSRVEVLLALERPDCHRETALLAPRLRTCRPPWVRRIVPPVYPRATRGGLPGRDSGQAHHPEFPGGTQVARSVYAKETR